MIKNGLPKGTKVIVKVVDETDKTMQSIKVGMVGTLTETSSEITYVDFKIANYTLHRPMAFDELDTIEF